MFMQTQLTAEQRLEKATIDIMAHPRYVALAGVFMIGNKTIDETFPTAYTNGRDEAYGRAFVDSLSDAMLRYLMIHECKHKMYMHLDIWDFLFKLDVDIAGQACDYVINLEIEDENKDGFAVMPALPDGTPIGCLDTKYRGMSTKQVFDILYEQQEEDKKNGKAGGGGGDGDGDGDDKDGNGKDGNGKVSLDQHDWENAKSMSDKDKQALAKEVDEALRQGALAAGKSGIDVDRAFTELLKVQVNWEDALREFLLSTCAGKGHATYRRPNRRFISAGVYLPSTITQKIGPIVLAVDTSGSINQDTLTMFMTEIDGICRTAKPETVRLLYWGHEVVGDETYGGTSDKALTDLVRATKPRGGGGTDVTCVTKYMEEHSISPQAVVVLTDGELWGDWGEWDCPILWCIVDNKSKHPTVGKVVHIKS